MKKVLPLVTIIVSIAFLTLFSYSHVLAKTTTENEIQLRDEVILDLLFLSTYKALEEHFGEPKQYYCEQILQIEKKVEPAHFNVTVQLTTFEGAHDFPFDLVTITFSNKNSIEWRAIDIESRTLKPNEITNPFSCTRKEPS
ncbi:DUF3888 domain-containing protein [Sporosarcina sp. Marseille-Q4063]|uniref:DUF3888 domain-containing protein n=1 Tax=Sporosarcina sp. Marseille-Q4063 TaxID=2810514 RepID=UPI001BB05235|nr:DUF3888 domain-containing protein [Sporosarcina sp. Marseille-Q4063]QUW23618.1 DUF3888 domain-containing protein [Sporosarcina sp. Marseille-Q4063]